MQCAPNLIIYIIIRISEIKTTFFSLMGKTLTLLWSTISNMSTIIKVKVLLFSGKTKSGFLYRPIYGILFVSKKCLL